MAFQVKGYLLRLLAISTIILLWSGLITGREGGQVWELVTVQRMQSVVPHPPPPPPEAPFGRSP
ncbi:hypothetical protein AAG906_014039 [Vitis piasezkii]